MKTLMICFSQTGNTRKIADHIKEGILSNPLYKQRQRAIGHDK